MEEFTYMQSENGGVEAVKLLVEGVEAVVHDVVLVIHHRRLQHVPAPTISLKHGSVQCHSNI